jgi:hypothetical protein
MSDTAENPTAAAAEQDGQLSDSARVEAFSDGVLAIPITLSSAFRSGSRPNEVTAFILYAIAAAFMAFTWLLLFRYLASIGNQILPPLQVSAGQGLIAGYGGQAF